MHRIAFTSEELKNLQGRLKPGFLFMGRINAQSTLYQILHDVYDCPSLKVGPSFFSNWFAPSGIRLYKTKDPESVYLIIKYQITHKGLRKSIQYPYQVMYHLPYAELPLLMGHKDKAIQVIVGWRLELGR